MIIKNIHEKLSTSIQMMLIDTKISMPYYGNFLLFVNFTERENIGTCAVNVGVSGINFFYNSEFLNKLSQKEVNFVSIHEVLHLVWDHPRRTIVGGMDIGISNIAQDMIINHSILEMGSNNKFAMSNFIEIPKDDQGRNMALFIPSEYKGKHIFEELYEWLKSKKEKRDQENKSNGSKTNPDSDNEKSPTSNFPKDNQKSNEYGPNGKDPRNPKTPLDTWSLDHILDNLNHKGYLDTHLADEVPEEVKKTVVKDLMDRLESRGFKSGDVEHTLNKIRRSKKDYLSYIKRSVSSNILGTKKKRTITRPNRRNILGLKGNRKVKSTINCILDTSGSMGGTFEKVLSYIYRNDIDVNLIESDTEVKWVKLIKSKRKLESIKIHGLGGTILMSAVDYVEKNFNQYNTLIITDGYCDSLDLSKLHGRVLIITIGKKVNIISGKRNVNQIQITLD